MPHEERLDELDRRSRGREEEHERDPVAVRSEPVQVLPHELAALALPLLIALGVGPAKTLRIRQLVQPPVAIVVDEPPVPLAGRVWTLGRGEVRHRLRANYCQAEL